MKKTAKKIVAGTVGAAGLFLASAATAVNADSVHRVVKNDTVWALSQKFGVSIKSIEQLNHIDQNTNMIYVGQIYKFQIRTHKLQKTTHIHILFNLEILFGQSLKNSIQVLTT